ncbi:MAG: ribonuclease R [Nitrospiraceae bacterium]|nr:ribonuclease R [Nitrospiraceae bacterium]
MINKQTVLSFFKDKIKKPLGFKELVQFMKLDKTEAYSLKKVLKRMLKDGDILLTRKGLYILGGEVNLLTGYFEAHRDGYGFVILEKPGERDIFIPARSTLGAMDSDRVVVRVENWKRRDGTIIRILERAHTKIVGKLDITKTAVYVRPKNRSIPFDLFIPNKEVGKAKDGDIVIAEITSYPFGKRPPSGKILKAITKPTDPSSEVESIIDEFNIPRHFPKDVNDEARLLVSKNTKDSDTRKDLRFLPTVTIDGERAKDFDDAVSIKLTENGYKLWVHIADVGFYVPWNSVIDLEARKRATSIYFPDRVTPMLPSELSEDLCSLRPNVDRFSFTVEIDFDRLGNKLNSRYYPSIIKSFERMTYTTVKKILIDNDGYEREKYSNLVPDFELMGELCGILRNKRLQRGSLDFDLPEPEVVLDIQGSPEAIINSERNFAHMIIEEFMISANESVAEHFSKLNLPSIYRIHEEPDLMKLEDIIKVVRPILKNKTIKKAKDFSLLLKEIKGRPEEEIVNYMVLRSLKQARYSAINVGHFGLASECYTHFTSPIRRYPDLVVHRILRETLVKKQLEDKRIKELQSILPDIAFHCSRMERRADDAEHEVIDAMRVWFMKDKVGGEFEGKIVNITPYGLKIRLKDFYVDGFLHVSSMTDDLYEFDERTMTFNGKNTKRSYTIGKEINVRIDKVDIEEREIVFGI